MTRLEAVAKAREARAAKKLARESGEVVDNLVESILVPDSNVDITELIAQANSSSLKIQLWREAMVAMMHNGKLNHPALLEVCSKFADEYTKFAMEKFK